MPLRAAAPPLAVFAVVLAACLAWSARVPFDGAPDEADHFAVVRSIAATGRMPRLGEPGMGVQVMDVLTHERLTPVEAAARADALLARGHPLALRQSYTVSPPLAYLIAGWTCRLAGGATVGRARAVSAVLVALAALATVLAALALWPGRVGAAMCAGLAVGLWPQVTFLGAYVNDDAFAVAAMALLVAACARVEQRGLDGRRAVLLGLGLGVVGAAKFYALAALPLALAWALAGQRLRRWRRGPLALALLVAALVAGPGLVRAAWLYRGDPTGRVAVTDELRAAAATLPPALRARTNLLSATPRAERPPGVGAVLARGWLRETMCSMWGCFGWMERWLPRRYDWPALAIVVAGLALSLGAGAFRPSAPLLFSLPLLVLLVGLSLLNTLVVDYQPQGRYLLVCVPALCLQMVAGLARARPPVAALGELAILGVFAVENVLAFLRHLV